jgi:hypothetical protein
MLAHRKSFPPQLRRGDRPKNVSNVKITKKSKVLKEWRRMTTATMETGEEIMTNQQFDAIIKMVLNTIDLASQDVTTMRKAILDLLIDDKTKQEYQKPLKERN